MFSAAAMAVALAAVLVTYRVYEGPLLYDRVLGTNLIGTKAVLLIALSGFIYERPEFMDLALVYALINFIATIAILKYKETGGLD